MQTRYLYLVVIGCAIYAAAPALADSPEERIDRVQYNRLVSEIQRIVAEKATLVQQGIEDARENGGKADLVTQGGILALHDRLDRRMTRATIIALRWGWELPDFNADSKPRASRILSEKDAVFAPAGVILRARFAEEAKAIARRLVLPVIKVPETATADAKEATS